MLQPASCMALLPCAQRPDALLILFARVRPELLPVARASASLWDTALLLLHGRCSLFSASRETITQQTRTNRRENIAQGDFKTAREGRCHGGRFFCIRLLASPSWNVPLAWLGWSSSASFTVSPSLLSLAAASSSTSMGTGERAIPLLQ